MFRESIIMSWQNIVSNRMRSFLTVLGIVIGVASIVILITIVKGVTENVTSTVSDMGANRISVQVSGTPVKRGLSLSDMDAIRAIENVDGVSPVITGKLNVASGTEVLGDVTVQGRNQVYFKNAKDAVAVGRPINVLDCNNGSRVALIGDSIAKQLFRTSGSIGKVIRMNGIGYTVIGTLGKSGDFTMSSNDDTVIIPHTTAMGLLGAGSIGSLDVYMKDGGLADKTTAMIAGVVNAAFNYGDDGYKVTNMRDILDKVDQMTGMMSMMLVGIASISLIVGGIGIMNMMLVSVTERTAEIGLRKALGAEPGRIRQQFLLESVFLSLFGGILGLIIGIVFAYLGCLALGTSFILSVFTVVLALGFSAAVGVVFGVTPAGQASRLNPIDALRSV